MIQQQLSECPSPGHRGSSELEPPGPPGRLPGLPGAQTRPRFEVIVVDNGSEDGSPGLVEELARGYPVPLRLIVNPKNRGFCAANNQGFAASQSEFVALLNNDAEADPGWLEALEEVIRRDNDIGMAASKILVWEDPGRIDKCGHLIYPDGQNRGRGSGQVDRGQFDRIEETLWPDGCAAMYRRAMLEDIGGFGETFLRTPTTLNLACADVLQAGVACTPHGRWCATIGVRLGTRLGPPAHPD